MSKFFKKCKFSIYKNTPKQTENVLKSQVIHAHQRILSVCSQLLLDFHFFPIFFPQIFYIFTFKSFFFLFCCVVFFSPQKPDLKIFK